ncbi:MAG: hypothetical protein K6T94_21170 [Paenibacillus sp.]|nr:hypothetical protein [Paenibacillus sp.]
MLHLGVIGILLFAIITFTIIRMKKTKKFGNTFVQSISLSVLLFSLACIGWLFQADGDGLAQLVGWIYYGVAFVLSGFLITIILFFMKKKIMNK